MDIDTPEMRAKRQEAMQTLRKEAKRVQRWDCMTVPRVMPKASVPGSMRRRLAREAAKRGEGKP